jgi:lipopolysaccharide/colanic/teichoic acid biosynthesis glycosyltransferase
VRTFGVGTPHATMAGHTAPLESLAVCAQGKLPAPPWDSAQRVLDVVLIAVTSPVWLPLLLLAVALKLLFDGRPVWFHHVRLGRNGRPFVMLKIRTTPAEFQPGPNDWSDEDFPPRTRLGRCLRRFDLDELPQLWNVLKGEMSLVGPRPEMPLHAESFSWRLPEYAQRLAVRPGLTGLAQARGWRGNTSIHQRLRSDIEYIAGRGPSLYFAILARTVWMEMQRSFGAG